MRRLFTLSLLLLFALPVGVSLSGCGSKGSTQVYCEGSTGVKLGQITNIVLQPQIFGKSLDYGQIDSNSNPTATDCKGTAVSVTAYKYASDDANRSILDINPTTGALCGGQWNRNVGGGVADYTFCTPTNKSGVIHVTASANGAVSNAIPVYVHPVASSISIVPAPSAAECATNPASTCSGCTPTSVVVSAAGYDGTSCVSQRDARQIAARVFDANGGNITCQAGNLTFTPITTGLVTIDQNGVATAQLPGSTIITAKVSNATSTAGLFSVCPPANITINTPNAVAGKVTVNPNNTESITATAFDTKGVQLTGLALTYTSTTPTTVAVTSAGILPTFPSSAAINAFCEPPTCNPSPFEQIGINGNGKPISSNTILSNTTGVNSTLLWIASTDSRYITPVDFTTSNIGNPIQLPYKPNSMVITQDGSTIYLGSDFELMSYSPATNGITKEDISVKGNVLAAAPDNSSIVLSDPARKIIYLYNPLGTSTGTGTGSGTGTTTPVTVSTYGGVATRAQYTPDSKTVYITTTDNRLLVYNANIGWNAYDLSASGANDVVAAIPAVGAFVGGNSANPAITGVSYCANTTVSPVVFYPTSGQVAVPAERLAATNDGGHILGAHVPTGGGNPVLQDVQFATPAGGIPPTAGTILTAPTGACPANGATFTLASNSLNLTGASASSVTGVVPASDSTVAFVTYLPAANGASNGTILPAYKPVSGSNNTPGTVSNVALANGATAPVAGVFASDNNTFYVGTAGDNLVHLILKNTLTDSQQINPRLPSSTVTGGFATPNLLVQKPRSTT